MHPQRCVFSPFWRLRFFLFQKETPQYIPRFLLVLKQKTAFFIQNTLSIKLNIRTAFRYLYLLIQNTLMAKLIYPPNTNCIYVMKNTYIKSIAFLLICLSALSLKAQNTPPSPPPFCASREAMQQFLTNPTHQSHQNAIETQIHDALSRRSGLQTRTGVVTLPVVVHIVHNNGAENISDAQVFKGIQDLNDAFANRGYYDPTTGVNTNIQFCLAQRNQNNQPTNGITRDVSPLTNMVFETDDENLKNINRWQTTCFINIWLVKEMTSNSFGAGLAGFAYYPSAHGSAVDGIVMEARWFGSSPANTTILIHEMGHLFGTLSHV